MPVATIFDTSATRSIFSTDSDYETARAGENETVFGDGSAGFVGQSVIVSDSYVYETFAKFDLSEIPAGSTINSVEMHYAPSDLSGVTGEWMLFVAGYDWGASVDTGDWVPGDDLGSLTAYGEKTATSIPAPPEDYVTFDLVSNNLRDAVAANAGGTLLTVLFSSDTSDGNAPTGGDTAIIYTSTSLFPLKLIVDYSAPPAVSNPIITHW